MADTAVVCVSCRLPFNPRDAGSFMCYWHPGTQSSTTSHLTCCGMSETDRICKMHKEANRENARGCHRADHSATKNEREAFTSRPYSICPLSQVLQMPALAHDDGEKVFHFADFHKMPKFLDIRVPATWGEGEELTHGTIRVDLRDEHDHLYRTLNAGGTVASTTDPYAAEWDRVHGEAAEGSVNFIPFVLFLRVAPTHDLERKEEFDEVLARPCS